MKKEEVSFEEQLARFEEQKEVIDKEVSKSRLELNAIKNERAITIDALKAKVDGLTVEISALESDISNAKTELAKIKNDESNAVFAKNEALVLIEKENAELVARREELDASFVLSNRRFDERIAEIAKLEAKASEVIAESKEETDELMKFRSVVEAEKAQAHVVIEESLRASSAVSVEKDVLEAEKKAFSDKQAEFERDIIAMIEQKKALSEREKEVDEKIAGASEKEKELLDKEKVIEDNKILIADKLAELDRRLESAKANEKAINERAKQLK